MIQYLNVLSDHENDLDKAREVFKAIVANLLGSSTTGGVGAAALIQQKAAKDTPAHAAELVMSRPSLCFDQTNLCPFPRIRYFPVGAASMWMQCNRHRSHFSCKLSPPLLISKPSWSTLNPKH
jgi:hypothetical protein